MGRYLGYEDWMPDVEPSWTAMFCIDEIHTGEALDIL